MLATFPLLSVAVIVNVWFPTALISYAEQTNVSFTSPSALSVAVTPPRALNLWPSVILQSVTPLISGACESLTITVISTDFVFS